MQIADVLPLTPLQQGLLFLADTAQGSEDVYAVQLAITLTGPLDTDRLHDAVQAVVKRHPHLAARFSAKFGDPVAVLPADPQAPWQFVDLTDSAESDEQIRADVHCRAPRGVRPGRPGPGPGGPGPRSADKHLLVMTNHHIVLDGWSLPILLGEIFASYYGQRLPPATPYRRFVNWLAGRDLDAARTAWGRGARRFRDADAAGGPGRPHGSRPPDGGVVHGRPSKPVARWVSWRARSTPPSAPFCRGPSAQLLMLLTGQHDVAFGTSVSGRPTKCSARTRWWAC